MDHIMDGCTIKMTLTYIKSVLLDITKRWKQLMMDMNNSDKSSIHIISNKQNGIDMFKQLSQIAIKVNDNYPSISMERFIQYHEWDENTIHDFIDTYSS